MERGAPAQRGSIDGATQGPAGAELALQFLLTSTSTRRNAVTYEERRSTWHRDELSAGGVRIQRVARLAAAISIGVVAAGCRGRRPATPCAWPNAATTAALRDVLAARRRAGRPLERRGGVHREEVVAEELPNGARAGGHVERLRDVWACARDVGFHPCHTHGAARRRGRAGGARAALDAHSASAPATCASSARTPPPPSRADRSAFCSSTRKTTRSASARHGRSEPPGAAARPSARRTRPATCATTEALAETARLDPEAHGARRGRLRALAALPPPPRGCPRRSCATCGPRRTTRCARTSPSHVVASPAVWPAGGRGALLVLVASGAGAEASSRGPPPCSGGPTRTPGGSARIALGVLARRDRGDARAAALKADRRGARSTWRKPAGPPGAPLDGAAAGNDLEVRVSAFLARLVETSSIAPSPISPSSRSPRPPWRGGRGSRLPWRATAASSFG